MAACVMLQVVLSIFAVLHVRAEPKCPTGSGEGGTCSTESLAEDLSRPLYTPLRNLNSSNPDLLVEMVDAESRQPASHCSNQTVNAIAGNEKIHWRLNWEQYFKSTPSFKHLADLHSFLHADKQKYKQFLEKSFVKLFGDYEDLALTAEYNAAKHILDQWTSKRVFVVHEPDPSNEELGSSNEELGGTWLLLGDLPHPAHTGNHAFMLVIEGDLQSASVDERLYHEALVHPALTLLPEAAQSVFIGGGGEGLTLREVLRHHSIRSAVMVDIDGALMDACHNLLGKRLEMSFDDPRAQVFAGDARAYLEQNGEGSPTFDAIVLDFPDFHYLDITRGRVGGLFSSQFYSAAKQRLRLGGILVVQAPVYGECAILKTLQTCFLYVHIAAVPMFVYPANLFFLASDNPMERLDPDIVDQRIAARIRGPLHFYRGTTHEKLWGLNATLTTSSECHLQGCLVIDNATLGQ